MNKLSHQKFQFNLFSPRRLVFQGGSEKAPPAGETFKGNEQQSEAAARNEVASQSPSQIFNDTISAGGNMQGTYTQGTTSVANLITNDPIFTGNWGSITPAGNDTNKPATPNNAV